MRRLTAVVGFVSLLVISLGVVGCTSMKNEVRTEVIPYKTLENSNPDRWVGDDETLSAGQPGEKQVTYQVTYQAGKEVTRSPLAEKVVKEPVDELVEVGSLEVTTGIAFPVGKAQVTLTDVQRLTSFNNASGDLLLITFKVDNSRGKKPFDSAARTTGETSMYLLWGGNFSHSSHIAALGGPGVTWTGSQPVKGTDQSHISIAPGKSGTLRMLFDLNEGDAMSKAPVSDPTRIQLLWGELPLADKGGVFFVNFPLSKLWRKPL